MTLGERIEAAFGHRQPPESLIERRDVLTPEQQEALWFTGRNWREVTREEWEAHGDAFYAFRPEAFAYYLPGILLLSGESPDWFGPADALLQVLDRGSDIARWDAFLTNRLVGLSDEEYEAMDHWLMELAAGADEERSRQLGRAFDTVNLLRDETSRMRKTFNLPKKRNLPPS